MAKRELSSTLKNLKFMQRASLKDEKVNKKEEEEVMPAGDFPSTSSVKRCVVLVEGDPHPSAARGRMSFLSFNPSIDKLNDEESSQTESNARNSGNQNKTKPRRENVPPENGLDNLEIDSSSSDTNGDLKRKQADVASETPYPNKSKMSSQGKPSPSSNCHSSQKQHKCEKLDWNVLRPPQYPTKNR